mgnify:CR=1 FL=1
MSHDQETTIADVLRGRMATYQFLSRLFRVEVDQELYDTLMSMRFPANTGNALVDEGYRMICGYLSQADGTVLTELAVDYVRAFIGSGNDGFSAAYPYESVYTSEEHLLMQDARDSAVAFYLGEELGLPADNTTPEDHLSFEFQFMAKLIERASAALDAGDEARYAELCAKQRTFFDEHLVNWVPRLCADVRAYAQTAFYRGVADITEGFLQLEDQMIGQSAQAA